jgi:PilZ domain
MTTGRVRVIQNGVRTQPLVATAGEEKRQSRRKAYRTPGLIYPGGVAASIPCMITDQSVTGAQLLMQPGWVNPFRGISSLNERFTLVMRVDRMQVECEIVRLDDNTMGVRFVSVAKPIAARKKN